MIAVNDILHNHDDEHHRTMDLSSSEVQSSSDPTLLPPTTIRVPLPTGLLGLRFHTSTNNNHRAVVKSIFAGSPLEAKGIQVGMIVTKLIMDGVEMEDMDSNDLAELLSLNTNKEGRILVVSSAPPPPPITPPSPPRVTTTMSEDDDDEEEEEDDTVDDDDDDEY